jgi:hypothetical protein
MTTEQKAIELLKTRIDTMDVQINDGLVDYSYEDLCDFVECAEFLSLVRGVKYATRKDIKQLENVS